MTCQKQVLQNQNTTETNSLMITIRLALGSSSSDCESRISRVVICCFLPAHCLHVSFMTTSRCPMFGLLQLGWIPVQLVMKTLKMSWSLPGLAMLSDHICCPAPPDNWLEMRTPTHPPDPQLITTLCPVFKSLLSDVVLQVGESNRPSFRPGLEGGSSDDEDSTGRGGHFLSGIEHRRSAEGQVISSPLTGRGKNLHYPIQCTFIFIWPLAFFSFFP